MGEGVFFRNLTTKGLTAINSGERYFEGYLTVQVKDKQGEVTIVDELMKVLPVWIDRGAPISDTHSNRIIGKGINYSKVVYKDSEGDEYPAIKITGKIHKNYELDTDIWQKIKSGEYKGLSFGGATKSDREPMRMKDGSIAYSLKDLEHYEVAVCRDPAVPLALITEYNTLAKAATEGQDLGDGRMLIKCSKFGCYVDKNNKEGGLKAPEAAQEAIVYNDNRDKPIELEAKSDTVAGQDDGDEYEDKTQVAMAAEEKREKEEEWEEKEKEKDRKRKKRYFQELDNLDKTYGEYCTSCGEKKPKTERVGAGGSSPSFLVHDDSTSTCPNCKKKGEDWSNAGGDMHSMYNQDTDEGGMGKHKQKGCKCGDPKCKDPKCNKREVGTGYGAEQNSAGEVNWQGGGSPYPKKKGYSDEFKEEDTDDFKAADWKQHQADVKSKKTRKKKAIMINILSRLKSLDFLIRGSDTEKLGGKDDDAKILEAQDKKLERDSKKRKDIEAKKPWKGAYTNSLPGDEETDDDLLEQWYTYGGGMVYPSAVGTDFEKERGKWLNERNLKRTKHEKEEKKRLKKSYYQAVKDGYEDSKWYNDQRNPRFMGEGIVDGEERARLDDIENEEKEYEAMKEEYEKKKKKKKVKKSYFERVKDGEFGGMNTGETEWTEPRDSSNERRDSNLKKKAKKKPKKQPIDPKTGKRPDGSIPWNSPESVAHRKEKEEEAAKKKRKEETQAIIDNWKPKEKPEPSKMGRPKSTNPKDNEARAHGVKEGRLKPAKPKETFTPKKGKLSMGKLDEEGKPAAQASPRRGKVRTPTEAAEAARKYRDEGPYFKQQEKERLEREEAETKARNDKEARKLRRREWGKKLTEWKHSKRDEQGNKKPMPEIFTPKENYEAAKLRESRINAANRRKKPINMPTTEHGAKRSNPRRTYVGDEKPVLDSALNKPEKKKKKKRKKGEETNILEEIDESAVDEALDNAPEEGSGDVEKAKKYGQYCTSCGQKKPTERVGAEGGTSFLTHDDSKELCPGCEKEVQGILDEAEDVKRYTTGSPRRSDMYKAEEGIGGMTTGAQRGLGHEGGNNQGPGESAQVTEVVEDDNLDKSAYENHEQDESPDSEPNKQQIPPSKPGMDVIKTRLKLLKTKYSNIYKHRKI